MTEPRLSVFGHPHESRIQRWHALARVESSAISRILGYPECLDHVYAQGEEQEHC
jgi:hypothetical protein